MAWHGYNVASACLLLNDVPGSQGQPPTHTISPTLHATTLQCSLDNVLSSTELFATMLGLAFTATRTQIASYLFGVALFSIAFLVFLNSSISFVITQRIGQSKNVGGAVGTLGFVDELVALIACPVWGDRVGVRAVAVTGYIVVGLSLWVLVQAKNVYPQLLLARVLFSLGGSAT
jgi:MFS family permease